MESKGHLVGTRLFKVCQWLSGSPISREQNVMCPLTGTSTVSLNKKVLFDLTAKKEIKLFLCLWELV